jgi:hypothetical protein
VSVQYSKVMPFPSPPHDMPHEAASRSALRVQMSLMPPHHVVREVIAYLATCASVSGSPLTILQREYLQFLDSAETLASRGELSSAATHMRASRLLSGGRQDHNAASKTLEPVYIMDASTTSLRDVHTEFSTLQEAHRKLASESIIKDRRIASLQIEVAKCQYDLQVLRNGITSSHVVHASTVGDAELLQAAQNLNTQLAEQIAAFEDNFDVGNFVEVRELVNALGELKREKEMLIQKTSLLAATLLEGSVKIKSLQRELAESHDQVEAFKSLVGSKERDVAMLKDELEHALENVR